MTPFWRTWLTLWSGGVILFGATIAGAGFAATDGPVQVILAAMAPSELVFDATARFAFGLMGAVTMGWGLTFLSFFRLSQAVDPERAAPAWRLMLGGFAIWYVIDCAISIATGFTLNAVSNTALLILLAIPLFATGVLSADRRLRAGSHGARTAPGRG